MTGEEQSSGTALLVRPAAFGFHAEAAESNAFAAPFEDPGAADAVRAEFDRLASRLDAAGVEVLVLQDTPDPPKPDAIFPNNWMSFHRDGTMAVYPMATAARRLEREPERVRQLLESAGYEIRRTIDLTAHERKGRFLEGTGSLILDRPRRRSFASFSPRTHAEVVAEFDQALGYSTFLFDARDRSGRPIYHTNVLLSLGTRFAILCTDVVAEDQRTTLIEEIETGGRSVIPVTYDQMASFACNLIELKNGRGDPVIALSSTARAAFTAEQRRTLESFGQLIDSPIPTIERIGGGSVRCMITDVHLPRA